MSFINQQTSTAKQVGGEGNPKKAKIAFIGEAPSHHEVRAGKPFVGPAGEIFNDCIHSVGLIRAKCYVTNFVKEFVRKGEIGKYCSDRGILTSKGMYWRDVLAEELAGCDANILVPLGKYATAAICGFADITRRRGYMTCATERFNSRKALPTLHPSSCQYGGNYVNKYYIMHDLQKAKDNSDGPDVKYDDDIRWIAPTNYEQTIEALDRFNYAKSVFFDIEVVNYEVACISFINEPTDTCLVVDFYDRNLWTDAEELGIWLAIERVLSNPSTTKGGQNLIFDMQFLATHCNILVQGPIIDTMIAHSLIYPDMLKGLGFLGSIYVNRPYWKDRLQLKESKKDG